MWLGLQLIAIGVALLYLGGELLVRNVSHLALAFSISPLVIGLSVVAFGTSAPELATGIVAAAEGQPEIALGNVVGSNIANVGLILGLSALVSPLRVESRFVFREVAFMVATSALIIPFAWSGTLHRFHAVVLLLLFGVFMWMLARGGDVPATADGAAGSKSRAMLGTLGGLALLVLGAKLLVDAAVDLATDFGISPELIALTLVAVGTSVPELAGCLVAAARRQADIVVGNVVGSNVFNVLLILPVALFILPVDVDWQGMGVSILVMVAFSVVLMVFFLSARRLSRSEGALLLVGYAIYLVYLSRQAIPE